MNKLFKHPLALSLVFLTGMGLAALSSDKNPYSFTSGNDFIQEILEKFSSATKKFPEDRVYLQMDKPFYKPGESIWFKAYIRNGVDMKVSAKSEILHVEFITPKGTVEKEIKLIAKKGLAHGDFVLDENAAGGIYKIKAYTNWQKNESTAMLFEKDIQVQAVVLPKLKMKLDFDRKAFGAGDDVFATVQLTTLENLALVNKSFRYIVNLEGKKFIAQQGITTEEGKATLQFKLPTVLNTNDGLLNILIEHEGNNESISRSIPIVLNKIEFSVYPEGGDLVTGLKTKIAFKALNEFGKPADVEGFVENSKGEKIIAFKSLHQGMGAFAFQPLQDEKYKVKITKPKNIHQIFELPEALPRGYVLNVAESKKAELALDISSTEFEELTVVAQVRSKIYYTGKLQANYGINRLSIPTDKFPIGVAQITLFDSRGIERAERLAFVNKDKQLKVKIETDKVKYQPREKVKLTIQVTDQRGIPMPADFSLAVSDDKLLSFADDKSGNILSMLLLQYDIQEKVEEPFFYFDPSEQKADVALDNLLLTSGWRRFTWEQVLNNTLPAISYQGEKALVSGIVLDAHSQKPLSKAKVNVLNTTIFTETDDHGRFSFHTIDLTETKTLKITSKGYSDQQLQVYEYNANMTIHLYNHNYHTYHYKNEGMARKDKGAEIPQIAHQAERNLEPMNAIPDEMRMEEKVLVKGKIAKDKEFQFEEEQDMGDRMNMEIQEVQEILFMDTIGVGVFARDNAKRKPSLPAVVYYRAREFPAPVYRKEEPVEVRTDFRSTIYWNGNVTTDRTGKAILEFYNSDEISSFRIVAEGISTDGMVGRSEKVYFTQLPFSMSVKAPVNAMFGDMMTIPLTLKNNTGKLVSGKLSILAPEGLKSIRTTKEIQDIPANQSKTIFLDYAVLEKAGKGNFQISFKSEGLQDAFVQEIIISPKGFPASISFSGREMVKEYTFTTSNVVEGSLQASFTAYPSVVTDLMKGVESIIREPYGCFEQTSTSNYPNILVKRYIQETQQDGLAGTKKITMPAGLDSKLDKGYKKLISFETKEKGYEWFGGTPAHEALTAYGLMQFQDMKEVYSHVDDAMLNRTAAWLMSRKDGNGGFKKSAQALDQFGRANEDVTNAYITYALSEAGYKDIHKEADRAFEKAMNSKDPYQLALAANTMFNLKDVSRGNKAIKVLVNQQNENGSWQGLTHSITCSQGNSLLIETTSLSVMSLIKSGSTAGNALNKGIEFIVSSRDSYGGFGSTQGTVLALKALTEYAKYSKKTDENGTIEVFVDGRKVATKKYMAGETDPISIAGLEKYFTEGKHTLKVKYEGVKNPLPYTFAINYHTFLPNSSTRCKVSLTTEMKSSVVSVGETVRLSAQIANTTQEGLPMTMAVIGIPAGMSAQPWQLKEMQEKQAFDFYEVRDNNVFIYYRQMMPGEKKEIKLDLKAEISGEYNAPASCAYLYYTNEYKSWSKPDRILIKK